MRIQNIIRLIRPDNWIKNAVVLLPVLFGLQMSEPQAWCKAIFATAIFCIASSAAYIFNDIKDRFSDQAHPTKKDRPIASGQVSVKTAVILMVVLVVVAIVLAYSLSLVFLITVLAYLILQAAYTALLKNRVLVDVICIAIGFVLRAAAGAVAIGVLISPWLFICMFTICLFMGFCKRCNEIVTIGDDLQAGNHRPILIHYTPELLTHLITLSAGIAVVAFLFYGLSDRTVEQFGTDYFIYTLPLVIYGVFRFAMLSMKGSYVDPTALMLRDRPFQVTVLLWILMAVLIIYRGQAFRNWIGQFI